MRQRYVMNNASSSDWWWFESIPKIELHLHLEGAIPHAVLWELLQKYGGDSAAPTVEELARKFIYRDFPHFLETWTWTISLLREYDDFEFIAEAVAHDLARQNIRYAEMFYSPADFLFRQVPLETQRLTEAIRRGLKRVPDVEVALVADLVRNYGPECGARTLACVNEVQGLGVIGIGIGGSEHQFPPDAFAPVFQQARDMGFKTSAHAGEAAGPESIWGAIRTLRVDRVGHGTRAVEDPCLVEYLAENRIPLELCVLSNVRTGVVPDVAKHPAKIYHDRGIPLSINTDDPSLFGNSLAEEYVALHEQLGFSLADIVGLIEHGIAASWLPEERKRKLLDGFRSEFLALKTEVDYPGEQPIFACTVETADTVHLSDEATCGLGSLQIEQPPGTFAITPEKAVYGNLRGWRARTILASGVVRALSLWGLYFRRFVFGTAWTAITLIVATVLGGAPVYYAVEWARTAHSDGAGFGVLGAMMAGIVMFFVTLPAMMSSPLPAGRGRKLLSHRPAHVC
jgi:adenosine deaminase